MRPTGVVSKKVMGARTRAVREWWWMTREARSADSKLLAERMTVRQVKPGRGAARGEAGEGETAGPAERQAGNEAGKEAPDA